MKARSFFVLHTLGAGLVQATSAAEALRKCYVPGGYRHALAVFDAAFIASWHTVEPIRKKAPFLAFIGKPAFAANARTT